MGENNYASVAQRVDTINQENKIHISCGETYPFKTKRFQEHFLSIPVCIYV